MVLLFNLLSNKIIFDLVFSLIAEEHIEIERNRWNVAFKEHERTINTEISHGTVSYKNMSECENIITGTSVSEEGFLKDVKLVNGFQTSESTNLEGRRWMTSV